MALDVAVPLPPELLSQSTEAVIREARKRQRRRRRRRLAGTSIVVIAALAVFVTMRLAYRPGSRAGVTRAQRAFLPESQVTPKAPAALSAGPGGALYMIDTGRNEIIRYVPKQGFRVVVGDGHFGRSPSGTPGLRTHLELTWSSGLAVSGKGIVYFTEDGRISELRPNGIVTILGGGGHMSSSRHAVPARLTDLTSGGNGPAGLTFGPDGQLYVGTNSGVYRLGFDGDLHWVVGSPRRNYGSGPWPGVESNPAVQSDFVYAVHLAFDVHRDLFVAGGNCYCLYERTATAELRFVQVLRGQGGLPGSIASDLHGSVLTASGIGLGRLEGKGAVKIKVAWPHFHGRGVEQFYPGFGSGLTVGAGGQVYVDTDAGDSLPHQGLLEVLPTGHVTWLWTESN